MIEKKKISANSKNIINFAIMKKTIFLLLIFISALAISTSSLATNKNNRYKIVSGTNSIYVAGTRYPLNSIYLTIATDSIRVSLYSINTYGSGLNQITPLDSFSHYTNNGTQFSSVNQIDSFYQAKFVK